MPDETGRREGTVTVQGVRLHYVRAGSGPAMVLLHGIVGSCRNWDRNIEFLSGFRTVFAIDAANFGKSERVKGLDAGLAAASDCLAAFMQAVGIAQADVAGHSYGGATAMIFAVRHPELVRGLVLFAPANPFCNLGGRQMRFYATTMGSLFARRIIPMLPRALYRRSLERMYGDPRRIVEGVLEGYMSCLDDPGISHILKIMLRWQEDMEMLQASLPDLKGLPMLILWGDRDRAVALDSGEELARRLGVPLQVVPGAGHIAFEELPDVCNPLLGRWLTQ